MHVQFFEDIRRNYHIHSIRRMTMMMMKKESHTKMMMKKESHTKMMMIPRRFLRKVNEREAFEGERKHRSHLVPRSFPLFNGVYCRSIGVQCNPPTADQTTSTSTTVSEEDCPTDRSIRILTPSSHVLKSLSTIKHEFLTNGIQNEDNPQDQQMVITSTCLDDGQLVNNA